MVIAGQIEEAFEKYVDPTGGHHNVFTPAGMAALKKGMMENHTHFPNKKLAIQNIIGDGNLVAIHSHLVLGDMDMIVVHILHFECGKIVEMWDCGQQIPTDMVNKEGAF
jgi:predicted SnoaL-like aldol condensation-catalyzing enzyme